MILLDTHIWLWLLHDPNQISKVAQEAIQCEESQNGLLVSAISVWEVAVKSSVGKLVLPTIYLAVGHGGSIKNIVWFMKSEKIKSEFLPAGFTTENRCLEMLGGAIAKPGRRNRCW
jgi:hypothetical protein